MPEDKRKDPIELWAWVLQGGIFFFMWAAVAAYWQGGWTMEWAFWGIYLKVALVILALVAARTALGKGPTEFAATIVGGGTLVWLAFAGSFANWSNLLSDLAAATLAGLATVPVMRWLARRRDPTATAWKAVAPKSLENLDAVVWGALAWIFVSIFSVLLSRPLPTDPSRFSRLGVQQSIVAESTRPWESLRVGLALSGGGFRAAVFHAGVLQALEDLGVRVESLSTVSGGSIIGAYYAVGGDPKAFAGAVADGRFDLKRQLMMLHNAVRLPFPMRLPGVGVKLAPVGSFDRLDVQRGLLDRILFRGRTLQAGLRDGEPQMGQPNLMIAVTDLSYGFQIGLLPDGILKLGDGPGEQDVFRGAAFEPAERLTLARRVAISGAFPLAFPSTPLKVRVRPARATGLGTRELLLVDGGARDNTGYDLLRVADRLADGEASASAVADYVMPAGWDLDALLVSDASAISGVLETPGNSLSLLSRVVDVASIQSEKPQLPLEPCERLLRAPTRFSPTDQILSPDSQFNLKNDSQKRAALEREWRVSLDPARYPDAVLRRLIEQLQEPARSLAKAELEGFLKLWARHHTTGRAWSKALRAAKDSPACASSGERIGPAPVLPGACEAVRLEKVVREALIPDLETFRATSTVEDRLPRATVEALERLGKILVYLHWPQLEVQMNCTLEKCAGWSPERVTIEPTAAPVQLCGR